MMMMIPYFDWYRPMVLLDLKIDVVVQMDQYHVGVGYPLHLYHHDVSDDDDDVVVDDYHNNYDCMDYDYCYDLPVMVVVDETGLVVVIDHDGCNS